MSTTAPARRNPFRRPVDTGPRASFRELLPYLTEHRFVLGVVIVLGLVGAGLSLAQPAARQPGDHAGAGRARLSTGWSGRSWPS